MLVLKEEGETKLQERHKGHGTSQLGTKHRTVFHGTHAYT